MTSPSTPTQPRPVDVVLLGAALLAWMISMGSPVFATGAYSPPLPGGGVLLLGLLFGWAANGWAVYANPFFLFAAWRLCIGKVPRKSIVLMLLFAATLPLLNGIPGMKGGHGVHAVSWGWGAFMWLWSLVLLTAATAARRGIIGARGALLLGLLMVLSFVAAVSPHARQWRVAGHEDRALLLPLGMIYTTSDLCPIPLTWPLPSDAPEGEPLVLDIDAQVLQQPGAGPALALPGGFTGAHADGSAWIAYSDREDSLMIRQAAQPGTLLLQIKAQGDGAVLRLLKGAPRRLLYEQRVASVSSGRGRHRSLCPLMARAPNVGLHSEYGWALLRAMGQNLPFARGTPLARAEAARQRCPVGSADIDGIARLRSLDGREVILGGRMDRMAGFCSASYVVLAGDLTRPGDAGLRQVVYVLDRKSLRPLARFEGQRTCPAAICAPGPEPVVSGVRLEGASAVIETSRGEYVAAFRTRP
ncbi:hypothetical protein F2P45_08295 [Massilia sp. CCM 8733]|uniref:Uncharacterized protein n=1 Tax=Massilia mucilaginosa TaxID=2609282 RepID=A0ABX0NQJ3_9BURK|nr:hypothetical protein [Massilia mucilaginosa]NHZ89015.1 hypothetical protein [Massilia mucilaginosa]